VTRRAPGPRAGVGGPPLSPFLSAVRKVVRGIARGRTLSYGEVALRCGRPGAARAVVGALHALDDVPWWRVCRSGGGFAPQVADLQESLLRQEGWRPARRPVRRKARPRLRPRRPGAGRQRT
jgi:alkylated DNA nucleotide flippase Atl1